MARPEIVEVLEKSERRDLVLLDDGRQAFLYPKGDLHNVDNMNLIAPPPHTLIDSAEMAREYNARRYELNQQAIRKGAMEAVVRKGLDASTDQDTIRHMSSAQAEIALDTDKGNSSTRAFQALIQLGNYLAPDGHRDTGGSTINIMDSETAVKLLAVLRG